MRQFLSCLFILFCLSANAQFGLSAKFNNNAFSKWDNNWRTVLNTDAALYNSSYEIGLDYWFRLKNKRIEFFPEIVYGLSKTDISNELVTEINHQYYGLNLNTHFYVLDFGGDCNCPTWSKDGTLIQKGFFLMVSPGIQMNQFELTRPTGNDPASFDSNAVSYKLGLGAGIDIGINNLITISPFVLYNFHPSVANESFSTWEDNQFNERDISDSSGNNQIQLGIRIGFRPDYKF